jgi:hypothetical protein
MSHEVETAGVGVLVGGEAGVGVGVGGGVGVGMHEASRAARMERARILRMALSPSGKTV